MSRGGYCIDLNIFSLFTESDYETLSGEKIQQAILNGSSPTLMLYVASLLHTHLDQVNLATEVKNLTFPKAHGRAANSRI